MFCRKCGHKNDDNALNCVNCGEPVSVGTPPQQVPVTEVAVKKKKGGKAGTIFAFILFLLVAGGCGMVCYFAYSQNAQTSLEISGLTDVEQTTEDDNEDEKYVKIAVEDETEEETETETEEITEVETEVETEEEAETETEVEIDEELEAETEL